MMKGIDIL